jgi:outer membrane protein TolC
MAGLLKPRPAATLVLLALAGCSPVQYQPRELDADRLPEEYGKRSTQQEGLAQFAAQSGYSDSWPPSLWALPELTIVALYFDPRIRTARAQHGVARARLSAAASRESFALVPMIEHHSEQLQGDSPWSLGVALELPWVARSRREARLSQAAALADAAQLGIAQAVWESRAGVRDALIDLVDRRQRLALLERASAVREEMRALVARRVEVGVLSARELGQEQALLSELEAAVVEQRGKVRSTEAALAAALGVPLEMVEQMKLADVPITVTPPKDAAWLRSEALRNRLDVQRRLLEFAAADADLKLAVAAQYPELALSPGYLWDQGDSVWSLATKLVFPTTGRAQARIVQAQAERELAAQRFLELQSEVIAQTESAWSALESSRAQVAMAGRQVDSANSRLQRAEKLFQRGGADRLELTAARLAAGASADTARQANTALLKALARAEDVMQQPLPGQVAAVSGSAR